MNPKSQDVILGIGSAIKQVKPARGSILVSLCLSWCQQVNWKLFISLLPQPVIGSKNNKTKTYVICYGTRHMDEVLIYSETSYLLSGSIVVDNSSGNSFGLC